MRARIFDSATLRRVGLYAGIALLVITILLPLVWVVIASVTDSNALFTEPRFYPSDPTLEQYRLAADRIPLRAQFFNSLIIAVMTTICTLTISFLAAYGFARYRFPLKNILLLILLLSIAVPPIATAVPLFNLLIDLNLLDTKTALVGLSTSAFTPIAVFILSAYIRQLPREVEEAAEMDGAGMLTIIFRIIAPMAAPALATLAPIMFILSWNEVFYPLVFSFTDQSQPLSVGLVVVSTQAPEFAPPWGQLAAMSVLMIIPVVLLIVLFEPLIRKGLTAGAVK